MKKKKRKKTKHSVTFVPRYLLLPAKIGKEYIDGATMLELAIKYKSDTGAVRQRLASLEVPIRRAGIHPGRLPPMQKLKPEQILEILLLDEQNMSHMDISRKFDVTRERIRQICLQAGHKTRRERMTKSLQIKEAAAARKMVRYQKILQISEAWKKGSKYPEIATLIWGEYKPESRTQAEICYFRKQYGLQLFPRRRPGHWKLLTAVQRHARLMAISKDWIEFADYKRIKKIFGYKSIQSAIHSIQRLRGRHPDLFPTTKEIIEQRESTNQNRP